MTRQQLLLIQLAEELGEAQHYIHKALRFGLDDVHPKIGETNADAIRRELTDIKAVLDTLQEEGVELDSHSRLSNAYKEKIERIQYYLDYSNERINNKETK